MEKIPEKNNILTPLKVPMTVFVTITGSLLAVALIGLLCSERGVAIICGLLFALSFLITGSVFVVNRLYIKYKTLTYTVTGFTVRGTTYRYRDIDVIEIMNPLRGNSIQYGIYMNGQCVYMYNDWFKNCDEFNRVLKSHSVRFMH